MDKPIMVNLWAAPGVGKSSMAAMVFNVLKREGVRAELVTEFAKDLTYEKNWAAFQDQFYVSAMQERRASRLIGQVDVIITDSPPGLGMVYASVADAPLLRNLVMYWRNRYTNVDFLLKRDPNKAYQTFGRSQTEQESKDLDHVVEAEMLRIVTNYHTIQVGRLAGITVAEEVIRRLGNGTEA
jgi:hypothetical protein